MTRTLTIHVAKGPMTVACHPTRVPGLVVHKAPGNEKVASPLWVLAHEQSGLAIAKDFYFYGRGEADLTARGLAPLTDWTQPLDDPPDIEDVRKAFDDATAWRTETSDAVRSLVYAIGNDVVVAPPAARCTGERHRIRFGWGEAGVASSSDIKHELTFAPADPSSRVWRIQTHVGPEFGCLDCGQSM